MRRRDVNNIIRLKYRKHIFFVLILFLFFQSCTNDISLPSKDIFIKFYGSSGFDQVAFAEQLENEDYMLVGTSANPTTKLRQFTALRTNSFGVKTSQVYFGENDITNGKGFIKTADNDYVFYGEILENDNNSDFYIVRTNQKLEKVWEKRVILQGSDEEVSALIELQDGNFFLLGSSASGGEVEAVTAIITKAGVVSGPVKSGLKTTSNSLGKSVVSRPNNRVCWSGTTFYPQDQNNSGTSDISLIFDTADGISDAGTFSFGRKGNDIAADIQKAPGGYILVGTSEGIDNEGSKILALKTDPNGELVWQKVIGPERSQTGNVASQKAISVSSTKDGGYIILGTTDHSEFPNQAGQNIYLVKLDAFGDIEWEEVIGGMGSEDVASIRQTKDNGFIIAATINLNNDLAQCLIKTNSRGKLTH
jgi:hypothetical protein